MRHPVAPFWRCCLLHHGVDRTPAVQAFQQWPLQRAAAAGAIKSQPSNGVPAVQALQQRLLQCAAAAAARGHPAVAAVPSGAAPAP